jgi:hypothetical protein
VKSIGYLDRLRRTPPRTFGISACAITADHLDAGMSPEPFRQCVGFAIGKKIDGSASFQVHQNCPIAMTAAPGPIIHPENFDITGIFSRRSLAEEPQDCVCAAMNSQLRRQTTTRFPTHCVADLQHGVALPTGLSPMGRNHDRQPLREDPAGAIRRPTIKTMRPQTDSHRRTVAREIAQRAAISTVNVSGMSSTPRTSSTNGGGRDDHHHDAALPKHVGQRQARWIGQA